MHENGRRERLSRVQPCELAPGQHAKVVVHQREQPFRGLPVTLAPAFEQTRHVVVGLHSRSHADIPGAPESPVEHDQSNSGAARPGPSSLPVTGDQIGRLIVERSRAALSCAALSLVSTIACALHRSAQPCASGSAWAVSGLQLRRSPKNNQMTPSVRVLLTASALVAVCSTAAAQPMAFEDVVRNLRNPDPKVRMSALQLLHDAKYPEAIIPIAALIKDPINEIQMEAIDAELSFFLADVVTTKSRVAFVVEVRSEGRAAKAFQLGPMATLPKAVPQELVRALLEAVDDEMQTVRLEALYTLGVIGRGAADRRRGCPPRQGARPLRPDGPCRGRACGRPAWRRESRRRAGHRDERLERAGAVRGDACLGRDARSGCGEGIDRTVPVPRQG